MHLRQPSTSKRHEIDLQQRRSERRSEAQHLEKLGARLRQKLQATEPSASRLRSAA
jgi:hypothetical protein